MNQKEFGKLLKALRLEHTAVGVHRRAMTQEEFGEKTIGSYGTYQKLEQGGRFPRSDELIEIASELRLTSREKEELFTAAMEVDEEDLSSNPRNPKDVLHDLANSFSSVHLPVFIGDHFLTLVGYNETFFNFYNADFVPLFDGPSSNPLGLNILSLLFSNENVAIRQSFWC